MNGRKITLWSLIAVAVLSGIIIFSGNADKAAAAFSDSNKEYETITCVATLANLPGLNSGFVGNPQCTRVASSKGECFSDLLPFSFAGFVDDLTLSLIVDDTIEDSDAVSLEEALLVLGGTGTEQVRLQADCVPKQSHEVQLVLREDGQVLSTKDVEV